MLGFTADVRRYQDMIFWETGRIASPGGRLTQSGEQSFNSICKMASMCTPIECILFLWPTELTTPNGISIESAVFPQYMLVSRYINGQTD